MPSSKDPRHYIKLQPIPSPSHKGIQIQARSATDYTATTPDRNSVRRENYKRRLQQLQNQGFHSAIHKPYQGIGDPFYLEEKKLILHAVGQWNEGDDLTCSSSEESEEEDFNQIEVSKLNARSTPAKFILRRTRKDLNTIGNEIKHARSRTRNVRLGHALNHVVEREIFIKRQEKNAKEALRKKLAASELKAPTFNSSDEDSDADPDNFELRKMLVSYAPKYGPDGELSSDGEGDFEDDLPTSRGTRGRLSRSARGKKVPPRPFTPQHMNISSDALPQPPDNNELREALFRQLCVLYWILESMNPEQHQVMGPITTCWYLDDVGHSSKKNHKTHDYKKSDAKWEKFLINPTRMLTRRGTRERLTKFSRRVSQIRAPSTHRSTTSSRASSPLRADEVNELEKLSEERFSDVRSDESINGKELDTERGPKESEAPNIRSIDIIDIPENTDVLENSSNNAISSDSKEAVHDSERVVQRESEEKIDNRDSRTVKKPKSSFSRHDARSHEDNKILERFNMSEEDPRLHALVHAREKLNSQEYRADTRVRPRSSPAVMEFKANSLSNQRSKMALEMRQKFAEITEEKALMLHDTLEAKERQRRKVLKNKLQYMPTDCNSYFRAIQTMRAKCRGDEEKKNETRRMSVTHQSWYVDLMRTIPDAIKNEWNFMKILNLLSRYGRVESAKQSAYRFLKVLSTLRDWEICGPDISASIEFTRERIVEMSVDEYEDWFHQQFPMIQRPITAPADMTKKRSKTKSASSGESQWGSDRSITSAPAKIINEVIE